jgi:hypothetical protein
MNEVDDAASVVSSAMMSHNGPKREDFDALMDDFLGSYSMAGKRRVKKGKYQTGMEQLDELVSTVRYCGLECNCSMTFSIFDAPSPFEENGCRTRPISLI